MARKKKHNVNDEDYTLDDLHDYCRENGLHGYTTYESKADLIKAINKGDLDPVDEVEESPAKPEKKAESKKAEAKNADDGEVKRPQVKAEKGPKFNQPALHNQSRKVKEEKAKK